MYNMYVYIHPYMYVCVCIYISCICVYHHFCIDMRCTLRPGFWSQIGVDFHCFQVSLSIPEASDQEIRTSKKK